MIRDDRRQPLRKAGKRVFDLVCERSTPEEWAMFLKVPLESAAATGDLITLKKLQYTQINGRKALRGAEKRICDLVFATCTPEVWSSWLRPLLKLAALAGDKPLVRMLVRAKAEIGDAVHEAVRAGHAAIVDFLLDNGAPIGAQNADEDTPLHVAARHGKVKIARSLLRRNAEMDAGGYEGGTPLYWAARDGHIGVTNALLAAGADYTVRRLGAVSPLDTAAAKGHVKIMKAIIKRGANVNAVDPDGRPALHFAAFWNKPNALQTLLKAGADVTKMDSWGSTALSHAACRCSIKLVRAVLAAENVDLNVRDQDQRTPLHFAAGKAGRRGAAEVVDLLLRSGADEELWDDDGLIPAEVVGREILSAERHPEPPELVAKLLANAPADRAWRRRGLLIMCRARHDKAKQQQQQQQITTRPRHGGMSTRSRTKLARADISTGGSAADERDRGEWGKVAARVLNFEVEGVFRTIVGFL